MIRRLEGEAGYSLVEVMASIVILTIAIIPMVAMFDMGLTSATTSSNYDKARALANLKLEEAKSLPYDSISNTVRDVKDNFPGAVGTTTTYSGSGYYKSSARTDGVTSGLTSYTIEKQFVDEQLANSSTDKGMAKVTVTVAWGNGKSYKTSGVVGK